MALLLAPQARPVVSQDPATGVTLLSVQRFNKTAYTFLCADSKGDHQWTVERTFKCIRQLQLNLVDCGFLAFAAEGGEGGTEPKLDNSEKSVEALMRRLLQANCSMARVLLSEVDAQDKASSNCCRCSWHFVAAVVEVMS